MLETESVQRGIEKEDSMLHERLPDQLQDMVATCYNSELGAYLH